MIEKKNDEWFKLGETEKKCIVYNYIVIWIVAALKEVRVWQISDERTEFKSYETGWT